MNKSKLLLVILPIIVIVILLNTFPNVSSAPPVTQVQQFTEGYIIEKASLEYLKVNQDYTMNFFLRNISTGHLVTNESVNCTIYIANASGDLLYSANATYTGGYWNLRIKGGNFSKVGFYPHGIGCNGDVLGGDKTGVWQVTSTGMEINSAEPTYIFLSSLLFVIMMILLIIGFNSKKVPLVIIGVYVGLLFGILLFQTLMSNPSLIANANTFEMITTLYGIYIWLFYASLVIGVVLLIILLTKWKDLKKNHQFQEWGLIDIDNG